MRYLTLGAILWLFAGGTASAQAPDPQVLAPINKFIEAFNKGDVPGAAATHIADDSLVIVDEVAPYAWRGAKAFQAWVADLDADSKKLGITDQNVAISAPTSVETSGDSAYVISPVVYTFKERGVSKRAAAQMTVVLKKTGAGWLITGWTWTGPRAQAAGKATKTKG